MRRIAFWLTLGMLLAGIGACGPVWAAEAGAGWGVVDMARVAAEYQGMHELDRQFQEFQQEQAELVEQRHKTRLLDDKERQEFLDRSQMGAPTEERDERLAELEELSNQRERRLLELRQKKERTPGEEEEYRQLNTLYDRRMGELAALQADIQQSRMAKYDELTKLVTESVSSAVKAVAEEKELAIVVRKEVVLYGGTDITDEVVTRLNAEEPKEAAGE